MFLSLFPDPHLQVKIEQHPVYAYGRKSMEKEWNETSSIV